MQNQEFLAQIANTFAHEYLHFLEFYYCVSHKAMSSKSENVSEALADFFSMLYSLNKADKEDLDVARKEYSAWKRYWGSNWPYAYAICFYWVNGNEEGYTNQFSEYNRLGIIRKFIDVFQKTPTPYKAETCLTSNYS